MDVDLYIAAPFGNYLHTKETISVAGTFTVKKRPGLIKQLIKTLRYDFKDKCWYNALGLRNPGIEYGLKNYREGSVMSIGAIEREDYDIFNAMIKKDVPLEINISCPNLDHYDVDFEGLPQFVSRNPILKLTPDITREYMEKLLDMGFTRFHCSNTLKTERGGRSGGILWDYTYNNISYLRHELGAAGYLIAGGGVMRKEHVTAYREIGADAVSLGSICFNPLRLMRVINGHAEKRVKLEVY